MFRKMARLKIGNFSELFFQDFPEPKTTKQCLSFWVFVVSPLNYFFGVSAMFEERPFQKRPCFPNYFSRIFLGLNRRGWRATRFDYFT